jgi:quinoprotein glucose dehydrogenase
MMQREGETVPAIAQATKMGHIFFLSQIDGQPVFPVEERPVPQTDVPGEYTSPTQRFPTTPPPLYSNDIFSTLSNLNGLRCHGQDLGLRYEGAFTPPSLQGSVDYPGPLGGVDWGGVSIDPVRRVLVLTQNHIPMKTQLIPKYKPNGEKTYAYQTFKANGETDYEMTGAPYVAHRVPIVDAIGVPCTGNPAGEMVAINIDNGSIVWRQPFGTVIMGLIHGGPSQGGSLVTAGGLVFIGASTDGMFRAIDIADGKELWHYKLHTSANATPMTYSVDGEQYVVIAAGGHALLKTKEGDEIMAFKIHQ